MKTQRYFRRRIGNNAFILFDSEISPTIPVYDGAPHGNDSQIVLTDEESERRLEKLNREGDE